MRHCLNLFLILTVAATESRAWCLPVESEFRPSEQQYHAEERAAHRQLEHSNTADLGEGEDVKAMGQKLDEVKGKSQTDRS